LHLEEPEKAFVVAAIKIKTENDKREKRRLDSLRR